MRSKLTSSERLGASLVGVVALLAVAVGLFGRNCSGQAGSDSVKITVIEQQNRNASDSACIKENAKNKNKTRPKGEKEHRKRKGSGKVSKPQNQPRDFLREHIPRKDD